ncbi:MAG: AAA family ATPase [Gammaproteobacteria bacterium]|nr:AAA family ATPase [Gammaproteobacteria bacterium]
MSAIVTEEGLSVQSLLDPAIYDPPVSHCQLIETHISQVILAGDYVYKIKKPVNLGFLDFSTLDKRRFYCEEELRLNKRMAPSLYLSVVPVIPDSEGLRWGGESDYDNAVDYAVKMKAFPQENQLDRMLARGELNGGHIDELAKVVAQFHLHAPRNGAGASYGDADHVWQPVEENFRQITERVAGEKILSDLRVLEQWSKEAFDRLRPLLEQRKRDGFIRECHGDMHLRNIAWLDGEPLVFDCIEFSADLRWIDVISDIAFLVMDLQDRKQSRLAQRFLNAWLEWTGDYDGLQLLRFYLVYRALVRAKVDAIRWHQPGISKNEALEARQDFLEYIRLALRYTSPEQPVLVIAHGVSASGKSTVTRPLLEQLGAIRIRSDVERKRMFGLYPGRTGPSVSTEKLYSIEASEKTYARLLRLAGVALKAGYAVIVDAVFLHYHEREMFHRLACNCNVRFVILEFSASEETLRRRIASREPGVSDADLPVLEMQLGMWRPLKEPEQCFAIEVNTERVVDPTLLAQRIRT